MGIYLNPGNDNFKSILKGDIYVDKTELLSILNLYIDKGNKYICISRPRRFGKTITGNMIAAYYSKGCNSKKMFSDLKIAETSGFKEKINKYNVIQIDINSEYQNTTRKSSLIKSMIKKIKAEIEDEFHLDSFSKNDSLADRLLKVYKQTGETFIIIMDEYDILVRESVSQKIFDEYLSFLNGLFKSNTVKPAISLAYLTGILPVVRDKIQSKLNNFIEYTMLNAGELSKYVGFTTGEVKALCDKYGMDFDIVKHWYDGYRLDGEEVYNPESVVMCMKNHAYSNYWSKTSSYAAISDRIRMNFAGTKEDVVKMLAGEKIDVNITSFMNTMDSFKTKSDIFTYLLHLGYLAYDRYDEKYPDHGTCRIPNAEILQEWLNAIEEEPGYEVTNGLIKDSKELLERTLACDEDTVAAALDVSHIHVTSNRSYNNEAALQSAIYLAYIFARNKYYVFFELTTGKGYADVVYVPFVSGIPAMIIELKHNKSAESALKQIKGKKYFASLSDYKGEILFVGINYDDKKKTHKCKIEKFEK